jgi:hypothetical protein
MAAMLAGSWRRSPPELECSADELKVVAPLLQGSGTAALCWWRLQYSSLRNVTIAKKLHQAYRLNTLQAVLSQQAIKQAIALLRSAEVEPILVKGWAAAGVYPEEGMRPYGDIDLCVRPEQFGSAETVLKSLADKQYELDLHKGFTKFGGGSADELYARSRLIRLEEINVRVLSSEDHLRFLCIHMLREGAWRPLWLCDVAAAVESRSADFDWDCCLTQNRRLSDWVICAIRLAHQLLDANISATPADKTLRPLPRWLIPTILKEWATPLPSMIQRHYAPMASYWSYPANLLAGLRHRWPNPIEATISVSGKFNRVPRLPYQVGSYFARSAKFGLRIPKLLRGQH